MSRLPLLQSPGQEEPIDTAPSDAALVADALAGNVGSHEALFRRHRNSVYRLACRLVGRTEADDLLQDCFIDAFRSLPSLRDPGAFGGWLSAIVVRTAHKRVRRRRLLERLGLLRRWPVDIDMLIAPSVPPDVAVEIQKIYRLLGSLPAEAQIALVLHRIEGFSLDEIAVKMNRSLATVKRRLSLAAAHLDKGMRTKEGKA